MQSNLTKSQSSTNQENKRRKIRESFASILFKFKSQHHIDPKDLNKCSKLLKSKVILDTEKLNYRSINTLYKLMKEKKTSYL